VIRRKHFWIPAMQPDQAEEELNQFLQSHRIVSAEHHFVADGAKSAWALCVEWMEGESRASPRKPKVDYREVLDAETFDVFAALRSCRKELAERHNVPVYAILTNEQMAEIARRRPQELDQLKRVDGFGDKRVERYGEALMSTLRAALTREEGTE
jgi:superfamily II DNA helicase RecQ